MSVEAAPVERSAIPSAVRELAGELLPDAPRLAREMNEHLFAMMAELRERDDGELPEETRGELRGEHRADPPPALARHGAGRARARALASGRERAPEST
jgi:hypothetical protein